MPRPPPPAAALTSTGNPIFDATARALREVGHRAVASRHAGKSGLGRRLSGADLVAHHPDVLRKRSDERDAVLVDDLRKGGVLGQEPVAGMHRVGVGEVAGGDDRGHVEVALARVGRTDAHALVRESHMHRVVVRRRVDRHGRDPHFLAGAMNAKRDFAAVGDQDLLEHGFSGG